MKTTQLLICTVAATAAFAAVKAQGQNLTATLTGFDPVLTVKGTLDNGNFIQNYPSGVMKFTDVTNSANFDAFCVDPLQNLGYPETLVYQIQSPSLLANYDMIARLVGGYLASSRTSQDAAAVQWAIWETVSETLNAPSLLDGNVRVISPVSQDTALLANQYLANISNYNPAALTYLTNQTRQDVVTWNVVPEPASAGLAALSSLLLLRRRRA